MRRELVQGGAEHGVGRRGGRQAGHQLGEHGGVETGKGGGGVLQLQGAFLQVGFLAQIAEEIDHGLGHLLGALTAAVCCGQAVDQFLHQLRRDAAQWVHSCFSQHKIGQFFIADIETGANQFVADHLLAVVDGDVAFGVNQNRGDPGFVEERGNRLGQFLLAQQGRERLGEIETFLKGEGGLKAKRVNL